jgi:two-component sensor histidine kinase
MEGLARRQSWAGIRDIVRQWRLMGPCMFLAARYRRLIGADAAFCVVRRADGPFQIVWWDPPEAAWGPIECTWNPADGPPISLDPLCQPAIDRLVAAVDQGLAADAILRTRSNAQPQRWWRCWAMPFAPQRHGRRQCVIGLLRDVTAAKERHDRAQAVQRVSVLALSGRDIAHICRGLHRTLAELMPVRGCAMALLDERQARLRFVHWEHPTMAWPAELDLIDAGPLRDIVRTARSQLLSGDQLAAAAQGVPALIAGDAGSWLAVPLADSCGVLGVVCIDAGPGQRPLSQADRDTLAMVSSRLARIVRFRDAEAERQRNTHALATLLEISLSISAPGSVDDVLQAAADAARNLTQADGASISLIEPDGEHLVTRAVSGNLALGQMTPIDVGARGRAISSGRPFMVDDYTRWPGRWPYHQEGQFGRVLAVPLKVGDRPLGTLGVADRIARGYWRHEEVRLLTMFAAQAALAIENASLLEQARHDAALRARLLDEVNHRVRNNLSAVMGLLYAAREGLARDPDAVIDRLNETTSAVRGLAEVHALLSANAWQPISLAQLAGTVVRSAVGAGGRRLALALDVRPSEVRVNSDQAQTLALILNELATNSVKHGAATRGNLAIAVWAEETSTGIRLTYTDDGPGCDPAAYGAPGTIGSRLVLDLVHDQLGGSVTIGRQNGFTAEITFPHPRPHQRVFTQS